MRYGRNEGKPQLVELWIRLGKARVDGPWLIVDLQPGEGFATDQYTYRNGGQGIETRAIARWTVKHFVGPCPTIDVVD